MRGIHMQKMLWPCPGSVKDAVVSQIRHILSQPPAPALAPPVPRGGSAPTEAGMSAADGYQLSSFTVNRREKNKYPNTSREAAAKDLASPPAAVGLWQERSESHVKR